MVPAAEAEELVEDLQDVRSPDLSSDSAHFLNLCLQVSGPSCVSHLDVEEALAACFDLHEAGPQPLAMDHVRLAAVDHLLLFHDVEQVMDHTDKVMIPDSFQRLKIFSSHHEIFALAIQVFVQTAGVEVELHSAPEAAYARSDTAYAEHGTVSVLELAVEVHYVKACSLVAFEPAIGLAIATFVAVVDLDITKERFEGEALGSVVEYW